MGSYDILSLQKERGIPKMKKSTKRLAVTVFVVIIVAFAAYALGWVRGESFDPGATYETPAKVTEINQVTNWITLTDWAGEAWCIRGDGYEEGQLVIVVFNDNNTPENIYDDVIEEVRCLVDIKDTDE